MRIGYQVGDNGEIAEQEAEAEADAAWATPGRWSSRRNNLS
jgi:hypothetical protein